MSTRAEIRAAIIDRLKLAIPQAIILDDPDPAVARREKAARVVMQLILQSVAYEPNRLLSAHDQAETWTWEVQLLVPARGAAAEAVAADYLEAIFDQLCPSGGWSPNATGAVDCDEMNVVIEEYVGDIDDGRRLYAATYTHSRVR